MPDNHSRSALTHRTITIVSFVISVFFTIRYAGGRFGHHAPRFHVHDTPFTANGFVVMIYWIYMAINQLLFLLQYYSSDAVIVQDVSEITWHFTLFNMLHALWIYTFSRKHLYVISELILIINLFNLLFLYVDHKTYAIKPLSKWLSIHPPTAALPLSWLMYAIFWNGAVAFHSYDGILARILANVFIWEFLLVPGLFLILFNDWAIGFSSSVLVFGIGIAQLFTKLIAVQWIFAFVISGLLFLLSVLIAVPTITPSQLKQAREEARGASAERAPLLDPNSA